MYNEVTKALDSLVDIGTITLGGGGLLLSEMLHTALLKQAYKTQFRESLKTLNRRHSFLLNRNSLLGTFTCNVIFELMLIYHFTGKLIRLSINVEGLDFFAFKKRIKLHTNNPLAAPRLRRTGLEGE